MTALPKQQEPKRKLIHWKPAELLAVARRYFALQDTTEMGMSRTVELAQQVLPEERRRPFTQNKSLASKTLPVLRKVYEAWAHEHPEQASDDREAARNNFVDEEPLEPLNVSNEPLAEEFELPSPYRAAPPTPATMAPASAAGPLESALAGMVGHAVGQQIAQLTDAMREEMQRTREEFQSLLAAQYDNLMCYWDPKYKERHEMQAEYIPDHTIKPVLLESVKLRQKRVLIINDGRHDQFHNVRMHFKGVQFEFGSASNKKTIGSGAWYDLVVCTAFVSHKALAVLKNIHGNRVVQHDIRGMGTLVAAVKRHLDL